MTTVPVLPAPARPSDLPTGWRVTTIGDDNMYERAEIYISAGEYADEGLGGGDALIKVCHAVNVEGYDARLRLAGLIRDFFNDLTDPREDLSGD